MDAHTRRLCAHVRSYTHAQIRMRKYANSYLRRTRTRTHTHAHRTRIPAVTMRHTLQAGLIITIINIQQRPHSLKGWTLSHIGVWLYLLLFLFLRLYSSGGQGTTAYSDVHYLDASTWKWTGPVEYEGKSCSVFFCQNAIYYVLDNNDYNDYNDDDNNNNSRFATHCFWRLQALVCAFVSVCFNSIANSRVYACSF